MSDVEEITQLVLRERQGRDRGWWRQMAEAFSPTSRVRVSWIDASGAEFVEQSRQLALSGPGVSHRMSPPVIHLHGRRALAEVAGTIQARRTVHGVVVDLSSRIRLLYRLEHHGEWLIEALDAIYESDSMQPAVIGQSLDLDVEVLLSRRESYRYLAYLMWLRAGEHVPDDLPGDDRPELTTALYEQAFAWLGKPIPRE
ncbi:MAG: nuclear transport factor 2 family protein [Leucobacter sp.]